jgi:hypothetical protein
MDKNFPTYDEFSKELNEDFNKDILKIHPIPELKSACNDYLKGWVTVSQGLDDVIEAIKNLKDILDGDGDEPEPDIDVDAVYKNIFDGGIPKGFSGTLKDYVNTKNGYINIFIDNIEKNLKKIKWL